MRPRSATDRFGGTHMRFNIKFAGTGISAAKTGKDAARTGKDAAQKISFCIFLRKKMKHVNG